MRPFSRKKKHPASLRRDRSLEQLVFGDGWNRYTVMPAASFRDPDLALLLHRVSDPCLPRLFGRTGAWVHTGSPLHALPYCEPASIGLDQFPRVAEQALLLLEYVDGLPLSELDSFRPDDAIRFYYAFRQLRRRLRSISGKPVEHANLRPEACLMLPDRSFCFVDWSSGQLGDSNAVSPAGSSRRALKRTAVSVLRASDDAALAQTIVSLLREKPMASLHRLDVWLSTRALPPAFRRQLRADLRVMRPSARRIKRAIQRGTAGRDGSMTVIVIPWDDRDAGERNIRISVDDDAVIQ